MQKLNWSDASRSDQKLVAGRPYDQTEIDEFHNFYSREVFSDIEPNENDEVNPRIDPYIGKDGAQHMLKYLYEYGNYISPQAIDAPLSIIPNSKYFDVYNGRNGVPVFIEFKSYSIGTSLNTTGNVNQLIEYLSRPEVTLLTDISYVFNEKKLTIDQAKEKMKTIFRNNANQIYDSLENQQLGRFSELFNVHTLDGMPVLIRTAQELQDFCSPTNTRCIESTLFEFITIN